MRQVADRAQVGERVRECASCDAAVAFARPWPLASPALRLAHLRSHPTAPPLCTPPRRPAPGGHAAVVEAALRRGPHHSRLRRVGCARAGSRTRGRVGRRACCCSTSGGLLTTPPPLAPPILHPQQPIDEQAPTSSTTAPLATTTTTRRLPWARARRWARARGACAGAAAGLGQHACHSLPPLPPCPATGWRAHRQELQCGGGGQGPAFHAAGGRGARPLHRWWVLGDAWVLVTRGGAGAGEGLGRGARARALAVWTSA